MMLDNDLKEALTALLKAELSPVIERLDGIDNRLGSIDGRLNGIDNRLDRLELEQAQIKQAVLETNETVKRIEVIQEQQHRIIELLSARSIEHEAKIKRIL
jgi:archaellum component FlaC